MVVPFKVDLPVNVNDYKYHGVPIDPIAVCAQNGLHRYLFNTGVNDKVLITFLHPFRLFSSRDVNGVDMGGFPLDTLIARAQAIHLKELGFRVSGDALQYHREALVTSYLLGSSLCVVQKKTDQGLVYDFVTKSLDVLNLHSKSVSAEDRCKRFDRQLAFSLGELEHNSFEAVRMFWDGGRVRLDRYRVGSRSAGFVFPYYAVVNYVARLLDELRVRRVRLYYIDALGKEDSLLTTYHIATVAAWMGSSPTEALIKQWADWRSSTSVGYMTFPDLQQRGRFVSVPVLRITGVVIE